jgi:hypothetical protein
MTNYIHWNSRRDFQEQLKLHRTVSKGKNENIKRERIGRKGKQVNGYMVW